MAVPSDQVFSSIDSFKNYLLYSMIASGFTLLAFIASEAYKAMGRKKNHSNDKTEEKLDYVVESVHRIEERVKSIERHQISAFEIQNMIRNELTYSKELVSRN